MLRVFKMDIIDYTKSSEYNFNCSDRSSFNFLPITSFLAVAALIAHLKIRPRYEVSNVLS